MAKPSDPFHGFPPWAVLSPWWAISAPSFGRCHFIGADGDTACGASGSRWTAHKIEGIHSASPGWYRWCSPCQRVAPEAMDLVLKRTEASFLVLGAQLKQRFGPEIMSHPTLGTLDKGLPIIAQLRWRQNLGKCLPNWLPVLPSPPTDEELNAFFAEKFRELLHVIKALQGPEMDRMLETTGEKARRET